MGPGKDQAWKKTLCQGHQGFQGLRVEDSFGVLDSQGRIIFTFLQQQQKPKQQEQQEQEQQEPHPNF